MNKVITIDLNGKAYQLEEAGYDALRKYLVDAETKLKDNPDKQEIMKDLEQAIADKCDASLRNGRNVVGTKEIEEIILKMGPVEGSRDGAADGGTAGTGADAGQKPRAPKRLFRIPSGEVLMGVCNGIAAYFNIDVTLVRVLTVLLTIVTGGGWIVAYVVLSFVMPVARTEDDLAQAHGAAPFTAQDFIDRAHTEYESYRRNPNETKEEWKARLRAKKREWKNEWRERRHAWREEWHAEHDARRAEWHAERDARRAEWRGCHDHGGLARVIGVTVSIVLLVLFLVAFWSLIFHGVVFGHPLGAGHPLWISILFLIAIFWLASLPFRHLHGDSYYYYHHHHGSGLFILIMLAVFIWTSVILFPPVRDAWNSLVAYLSAIR